jgi:hypothetical protein
MILLKVIILQAFWFLAVKSDSGYEATIFVISILLVALNFLIFKPKILLKSYVGVLVFFILYGVTEIKFFEYLDLVEYGQESFPLWLLSLYPIFLGYYGDIFNKFTKLPLLVLNLIGGLGGVSAFWSGAKLSQLTILSDYYLLGIFISWAIFFPLSLNLFNSFSIQNTGDQNS